MDAVMSSSFFPIILSIVFSIAFCNVEAVPINPDGIHSLDNTGVNLVLLSIGVLCSIASGLILCSCCGGVKNRKGEPQFSHLDELSVFPSTISANLSSSQEQVSFEALPDLSANLQNAKIQEHLQTRAMSSSPSKSEIWFAEPFKNFPRTQLQYLKKLGTGWFGNVLEGRAIGIDADHTSSVISAEEKFTPVVVKCLREDAKTEEQTFFLQELLPYRNLDHNNVLKLLAYCLDTQPLLVLLQYCAKGNLKSVLKRENLSEETRLKLLHGVSQGLLHMHSHNFVHTDLAARNCLVTEDYVAKIGDYGFSIETYPEEYYLADNVALPLRWCAPEILKCTESTIETLELTAPANVWSFAVVMWEIFSNETIPYSQLTDDEVIQQVILSPKHRLHIPQSVNQRNDFDVILRLCWCDAQSRPGMKHISGLVSQLQSKESQEFDERWNKLQNVSVKDFSLKSKNDDPMRFESSFKFSSQNAPIGPSNPISLQSDQPSDSLTDEISNVIQQLEEALADESKSSAELALSEVESANQASNVTPLSSLCLEDEAKLTRQLEQEEFSQLARAKSVSVQNLMCLTVVDDGSESDRTSQYGSLPTEPLSYDKSFSSESNLKEAIRDTEFMQELESFQAEQKLSLITEDSGNETLSCNLNSSTPEKILDLGSSQDEIDRPSGPHSMMQDELDRSPDKTNNLFSPLHESSSPIGEDNSTHLEDISDYDNIPVDEGEAVLESGQFWKDQMSAWQEAAVQTRELLKEAATLGHDKTEENVPDELRNCDSHINEDDINALRTELNLKLGGSPQKDEEEQNHEISDNIVVNYDSRREKLSPISEETLDFDENGEDPQNFDHIYDGIDLGFSKNNGLSLSEEPGSLVLEDFESDSITCLEETKNGSDDFLLVDTQTNAAAIVNWGTPQLSFVKEESKDSFGDLPSSLDCLDDIDEESQPYVSATSSINNTPRPQTVEETPVSPDRFRPYFSGLPTLASRPIYESCDHASLPYTVNYPDVTVDDRQTNSLNFVSTKDEGDFWSLSEAPANTKEPMLSEPQTPSLEAATHDSFHASITDNEVSSDEEIEEKIVDEPPTPARSISPQLQESNDEQSNPRYTPDWESDDDSSHSGSSSSTSGEFVWLPKGIESKPTDGETVSPPLKCEAARDSCSDESSESGEEEFTPSVWNSQLTPQRSLLKSPEMESSKKQVRWKRQRHHRVYEYPPEPPTWHSEISSQSPARRTWGSTPLDFLGLPDHELFDGLFAEDTNNYDAISGANHPNLVPPLYQMAPYPFSQASAEGRMLADDCEFYIRSSGTPFSFNRSSFTPTEFFSSPRAEVNQDPLPQSLENENLFIKDGFENGNVLTDRESVRTAKENMKLDIHPLHLDPNVPQETIVSPVE